MRSLRDPSSSASHYISFSGQLTVHLQETDPGILGHAPNKQCLNKCDQQPMAGILRFDGICGPHTFLGHMAMTTGPLQGGQESSVNSLVIRGG